MTGEILINKLVGWSRRGGEILKTIWGLGWNVQMRLIGWLVAWRGDKWNDANNVGRLVKEVVEILQIRYSG